MGCVGLLVTWRRRGKRKSMHSCCGCVYAMFAWSVAAGWEREPSAVSVTGSAVSKKERYLIYIYLLRYLACISLFFTSAHQRSFNEGYRRIAKHVLWARAGAAHGAARRRHSSEARRHKRTSDWLRLNFVLCHNQVFLNPSACRCCYFPLSRICDELLIQSRSHPHKHSPRDTL